MKPWVLLDATPLRAQSGLSGIGRPVRDLLDGLHACREGWQHQMRVAAR
jgi:hypothetical protein